MSSALKNSPQPVTGERRDRPSSDPLAGLRFTNSNDSMLLNLHISWLPLCLAALLPPGTPYFELLSERAGDRFGSALDNAGDVNGDGFDDWIIGTPRASQGGLAVGRVLVVSGLDGSRLWQWIGGPEGDLLGISVAGAGDLDGDGYGDLLAGAPFASQGHGEVRLYSGASGALLRTWVGAAAGDMFGQSVSGVGDVNGDGVPDVLVGAPHSDVGGSHAGEAFVFSGANGETLFQSAGTAWDQLGHCVEGLGDVNGDGHGDFALGVPFSDLVAFNGGLVLVHSGLDGALLYSSAGQTAGDQFGFALSGGEDVNGDGTPDLVVVAPAADAAGFDSGAASVLSGLDGSLLLTIPGPGAGLFMSAAELIADLDGDGRAEVLTGTPAAPAGSQQAGLVRIHSGADARVLHRIQGPAAWGWFGMSLAAGADVDGDGAPEFMVGAPGHDDHTEIMGRVRAFSGLPL